MMYIILSCISLAGKSFLLTNLTRIYNKSQLHKLLYALFSILILQSFFELSLYYYADKPESPSAYWALIGVYICLFYSISLLPFIAFAISNTLFSKYLLYGFLSVIAVITFSLLFSKTIIQGVQYVAAMQSLTRVAGPYYFIFQVVFLGCIITTFAILIKKSYSENYFIRVRSRNLCLAFIPFFFFTNIIIIAMAMGAKVNAAGLLPFTFLIYFFAMIHNIQPQKQPDYMVFIPFTKKNKILAKTLNQLVYIETDSNKENLGEQLIDYYLSQPGLTQKEIAKLLNTSEATLSRRKKQLKK